MVARGGGGGGCRQAHVVDTTTNVKRLLRVSQCSESVTKFMMSSGLLESGIRTEAATKEKTPISSARKSQQSL